jgi:hypothetical protein
MTVEGTFGKSDVIAAGFDPGFSIDPTYWRVFIDSSRHLRQEVVFIDGEDPQKNELLRYRTRLSRMDFAKLWEIIDRIGFKNFKEFYCPEYPSTDVESHWATVRIQGKAKGVAIRDLHRMAKFEQHPVAIGLLELWDTIHRFTPHGKVPIEKGRRKPWWRLW